MIKIFYFFNRFYPILEFGFVVDRHLGLDEVGVKVDFGVFEFGMVDQGFLIFFQG